MTRESGNLRWHEKRDEKIPESPVVARKMTIHPSIHPSVHHEVSDVETGRKRVSVYEFTHLAL